MEKVKDFGMLAQVMPKPVVKIESGTLSNHTHLPDCQFFKSRVECDVTKYLIAIPSLDGGLSELILKVTERKFLFPNEIHDAAKSQGGRIIAFQWSSKKHKSPIYTDIKSRRKLYTNSLITLGAILRDENQTESNKMMRYSEFMSLEEAQRILDFDGLIEFTVSIKEVYKK